MSITVILTKPKDTSITVSIMTSVSMEVYLEYGTTTGSYSSQTTTMTTTTDVPYQQTITGLSSNTKYYYRARYRQGSSGSYTEGEENTFHTQRSTGSSFTFTVVADSHFGDSNLYDEDLYDNTISNMLDDEPDLHFDIGDAFMINLLSNPTQSDIDTEYKNQRGIVSKIGKTVPWMFCAGNREMMRGWILDGTSNNQTVWSTNAKKKYYPQPTNDSFYSGNTNSINHIGVPEDYYAFSWGDVRFIVLFPWLYTTTNPGQSGDKWDWSLGNNQYTWFKNELENSTDKFKVVMIHHVLGGIRGGAKWAKKYEWGGENDTGTYEFNTKRSSWVKTIHQLMVENRVNVVFQGHDHIYVQQDIDGIVYQTVPMPSDPQYALHNDGQFYYGTMYANSGHIRVTVNTNDIDVEYVRSFLPGDGTNKTISDSYTMTNTTDPYISLLNPFTQYPETDITITGVGFGTSGTLHFLNKTYTESHNKITSWTDTKIVAEIPVYTCNRFGQNPSIKRDIWVTSGGKDSDIEELTILKPTSC